MSVESILQEYEPLCMGQGSPEERAFRGYFSRHNWNYEGLSPIEVVMGDVAGRFQMLRPWLPAAFHKRIIKSNELSRDRMASEPEFVQSRLAAAYFLEHFPDLSDECSSLKELEFAVLLDAVGQTPKAPVEKQFLEYFKYESSCSISRQVNVAVSSHVSSYHVPKRTFYDEFKQKVLFQFHPFTQGKEFPFNFLTPTLYVTGGVLWGAGVWKYFGG